MWVQCSQKGDRGSKIEKEDVTREIEVGVIFFEDGGRAMRQGMQVTSKNLKRHENALSSRLEPSERMQTSCGSRK